jgi:hypothetical protein
MDLLVIFSREGAPEERFRCRDGDAALLSALRILANQDQLRAGDSIVVETYQQPSLIERGIA